MLWLYIVNTFFMLIIAFREVRRPSQALFWLIIDLMLPAVGFVLYFCTSNPVHIHRERLTSPNNDTDTLPGSFSRSASVISHALRHFTVNGLRTGRVQVLTNGIETYKKLIESIQNAERTIDLEYFIYRNDQIGTRITDLLIERATAGVQVRFVRDGYASRKFPHSEINRMMGAGIECRTIFPMRFPWILYDLNYRDHCKIVVIDKKEAFTGGINIGYEYTGLKPNIGFWRDTHIRIVGEVVVDLQDVFTAHWNIASIEQINKMASWTTKANDIQKPTQGSKEILQELVSDGRGTFPINSTEFGVELGFIDDTTVETVQKTKELQEVYIQTLEGNPEIPTQVIRESFFICLTQATKTIDIATAYFVPDDDIITALKTAVARGVIVRLLVPRKIEPTTKIVGPASRTYYGELLEAGVHIYLYNIGILHAKVMIIDGEIAEVGSANFDMRSYHLDYEVCEVFYSAEVARELTEQFELDLTDSLLLSLEHVGQCSRSQRILEQGARLLSPFL